MSGSSAIKGTLSSRDGWAYICFRGATALQARAIRLTDFVLAALMIAFFAPLMLVVAALVFLQDGGPVIFSHSRLGRHGKAFPCFKFRSMTVDADARLAHLLATDPAARQAWETSQKLLKDPRITPIGHFLRRSSLDELPQLFNVLFGDMSLVGPRPIVTSEAAKYGRYLRYYFSVRPGITGLWQVSGRSFTTYRRRVALDVKYVRCRNVGLYAKLLTMTLPAVMNQRGAV